MNQKNSIIVILAIPIIVFIFLLLFWVNLFATGIEGNETFLIGLAGVNISIVIVVYLMVSGVIRFIERLKKNDLKQDSS